MRNVDKVHKLLAHEVMNCEECSDAWKPTIHMKQAFDVIKSMGEHGWKEYELGNRNGFCYAKFIVDLEDGTHEKVVCRMKKLEEAICLAALATILPNIIISELSREIDFSGISIEYNLF